MRYNVSSLLKAPVGAHVTLDIDEGQHRLPGDLEVDYVRGTVRLTRTDQRALANARLGTRVGAECVRCLEPFKLPLEVRFEEMLTLFPANPPDKTYHIGEDGYLNLDRILAEQILLAMPIQVLCRPDCRGLCSQCGQNLNEGTCEHSEDTGDPRLAALRDLL